MEKCHPVKYSLAAVCSVTTLAFVGFYVVTLVVKDLGPYSTDNWTGIGRKQSSAGGSSCYGPPKVLIPGHRATNSTATADDSDDLVGALIDDLEKRTLAAVEAAGRRGRNISVTISPEEAEEWKRRNPCRSRAELAPMYSLRKHAKDLPINPFWEAVFLAYSNYHRVCMLAVGDDIGGYFSGRNATAGCQFVLADTGENIGVGNKLQVVANGVLYGIITRRVVLVPTARLVASYVCEPFVGSRWALDPATFPTPTDTHWAPWAISKDLFKKIDRFKRSCGLPGRRSHHPGFFDPPYAAADRTNKKQPYQRFFCPTEQAFYSDITWVYLSGCIYTIPKMFAVPTFRPTLEALFPDRLILTRLFRSMLLPSDHVWERVRRLHASYLQPSDRRVGIQMRYLRGHLQFNEMHELIDARVVDCVLGRGILPQLDELSSWAEGNSTVKVLVTSLYLSLHDRLSKMYLKQSARGGDSVAVVQLTHEDRQEFGPDVDVQAFTEILLLSLCDDLLVMPVSTFGGSAQAYGALTPWFVDYRGEGQREPGAPACERGRSTEVCNQYTSKRFDCKYDPEVGTREFAAVVPSMEDCPQIEFPYVSENEQGVHLMTSFLS